MIKTRSLCASRSPSPGRHFTNDAACKQSFMLLSTKLLQLLDSLSVARRHARNLSTINPVAHGYHLSPLFKDFIVFTSGSKPSLGSDNRACASQAQYDWKSAAIGFNNGTSLLQATLNVASPLSGKSILRSFSSRAGLTSKAYPLETRDQHVCKIGLHSQHVLQHVRKGSPFRSCNNFGAANSWQAARSLTTFSSDSSQNGKDLKSGLGRGKGVASEQRAFTSMSLLDHAQDHYNGVIIECEGLPDDPEAFEASLSHSLQEWQSQGKRGVWLKIPLDKSSLVPKAAKYGFKYHHAQNEYAMLTKWLPTTASTIPENLLYNVGVGAFVLNDKNEMLLVKEASGVTKGLDIWKMPTGLVDRGEDVPNAVEREVLEETGLNVKFDRVLIVRQSHGLLFGRSDVFFVCACKLADGNETIKIQENELEAASWIPFKEAGDMPIFKGGAFKVIMDACIGYKEGSLLGFKAEAIVNSFTKRKDLIIHPVE